MSSEKGTSTGSSGGPAGSGGQHKNKVNQITHQQNISAGKDYVKDQLGLVEKKAGPMDYLQKGPTTGVYASKLHGTKGGMDFYGQETQQHTLDFIKKQPSSSNLYATTTDGTMIKDSSGNPILTSKGKQLMKGKSDGAMGSGDPSGIMSSIAISKPMFKSQQKLQQMIGLGMAAIGVPLAGSMIYQSGKASYNKYIDSFYNQQSSTSISQNTYTTGNISNGQGNASDSVGTSTLDKSFSDTLVQDTSTKQKQIKLAMANQEIGENKRTFLKANKRTITAGMSTV